MEQSSLNFIFINGRGSSGKDTQAKFLLDQNPNAICISTGDIVRGAKTPNGPYGKYYEQLKDHIKLSENGGLIPDDVIVRVVREEIKDQIKDGKNTFIFTGFPRTTDQLKAVGEDIVNPMKEQYSNVNVAHVCYAVLEVHSKRRAEHRREKASITGEEIRADDKPEIVERRLETYKATTERMLHNLAKENRLRVIKSSGTIEDVRERTIRALGISTPDSEVHGNPRERR